MRPAGRRRRAPGRAATERRWPRPAWFPVRQSLADLRSYGKKLGEERQLKGFLQEGGAAGPAGAGLHADGALHGAQVAEPPELEVVFQVHQFLAGLVGAPVV